MLLVHAPDGEECIASSSGSVWWVAVGWISTQLVTGRGPWCSWHQAPTFHPSWCEYLGLDLCLACNVTDRKRHLITSMVKINILYMSLRAFRPSHWPSSSCSFPSPGVLSWMCTLTMILLAGAWWDFGAKISWKEVWSCDWEDLSPDVCTSRNSWDCSTTHSAPWWHRRKGGL